MDSFDSFYLIYIEILFNERLFQANALFGPLYLFCFVPVSFLLFFSSTISLPTGPSFFFLEIFNFPPQLAATSPQIPVLEGLM
jgi:hypothetical protein